MSANLENSEVATRQENIGFRSKPKEGSVKECSDYCTIAFISHADKVMPQIPQANLQQYMDQELQDRCTSWI